MESSTALRSFHYSATGMSSHVRLLLQKPGVVPVQSNCSTVSKSGIQGLTVGRKLSFALKKRDTAALVSAVKASEPVVTANSSAVSSSNKPDEKTTIKSATFPKGFQALLLEVCDETEVAELKLKIGEFEMHVKRNVGAAKLPISVVSPSTPPPVPSEPMDKSLDSAPPPEAPPKHSLEKITPFTNVTFEKSSRLAALEASGASGYVVVSCPLVGSFRMGRTVKGVMKPPTYKEGDLIKEGQIIGWVDQFQTELPIKSDVSGEVLKVLVNGGEAVGYGDPLIAVLPSFHGIR